MNYGSSRQEVSSDPGHRRTRQKAPAELGTLAAVAPGLASYPVTPMSLAGTCEQTDAGWSCVKAQISPTT
jgi:hypothetical protein